MTPEEAVYEIQQHLRQARGHIQTLEEELAKAQRQERVSIELCAEYRLEIAQLSNYKLHTQGLVANLERQLKEERESVDDLVRGSNELRGFLHERDKELAAAREEARQLDVACGALAEECRMLRRSLGREDG
jgi:chromosome segregation ATPase